MLSPSYTLNSSVTNCRKNTWKSSDQAIGLYINPTWPCLHKTSEAKSSSPMTLGDTLKPKHAPVPLSKEQLKGVFRRFDCNKDGCLSKEELKKAFNELGSRVPGFRAIAARHQADENGDGLISEDELEALVQYAVGLGYTTKVG